MPRKKIVRQNNRLKPRGRIEFPRNEPPRNEPPRNKPLGNELHHHAFQLVRRVIGGVIGAALIGGVVTGGIVIGDVESHHPLPANQEVLSGSDFR